MWSSFGRSIPSYVVDRDAFISLFKDRVFINFINLSLPRNRKSVKKPLSSFLIS